MAWHSSPHINGGPPGAKGRRGHVWCKRWPGEHDSGLWLGTCVRRRWGSSRGCGGCVGACGCSRGVGCGAVAGWCGLGWDWVAGGGSASSYSSGILADLLHEIPHEVRREGTWLSWYLLPSCSRVCTWDCTIRVHLHHDHRDCLVADPDDSGAGLSLSSLLIGGGGLWGGGLTLTCLLRLVG